MNLKSIFSFLFVSFISQSLFAQTTSVTFKVNMNEMITQSRFNPSTDFVDVAGTFNNWGGTPTQLSDADSDGIYEMDLSLTVGSTIEYKFRINGQWDGTEEFPGGGSNRSYTVVANDVVEHWYNDEIPSDLLQVAFTATRTNPFPGELITFTDQSNGNVTSWSWTFEGGTPATSNQQTPVVYFENEGSYDVTLTISDGTETQTLTKENYITVAAPTTYWWNDAVFYEIFVRSFYDSDGDGYGDFNGMTEKLDYLNDGNPATHNDLGITGIWLMPMKESPSVHGYDVTDYYAVEPDYGTEADFSNFLTAAHQRGIRVIIDFVMNHSSNQHPDFIDSKITASEKRDWYRWSDSDPNQTGPWGQQVWHLDGSSGDYYYGLFWGGMPDLNYETPEVKQEMFDVSTYWLNKDVDGFRLDAVKYIYEEGSQLEDTESTLQFWRDFRSHYKSIKPDAFAVGEAWTNTAKVVPYVQNGGLDYCFEFDLAGAILNATWNGDANAYSNQLQQVADAYPFLQWGTFLTNHDIDRVMSILDNDMEKMKLAASLLLTSPGVPYIYYGEEIGMNGVKPDEYIRTPFHWSGGANAGFSYGQPWFEINDEYTEVNFEDQARDYNSLWHHYRQLIAVRNQQAALRKGFMLRAPNNKINQVSSTLRSFENEHLLVVTNFGTQAVSGLEIDFYGSTVAEGTYSMVDMMGKGVSPQTISVDGFGTMTGWQPFTQLAPQTTYVFKLLPEAATTTSVTLQVDMNAMAANGIFNPTSETVDVIGNFNGWGDSLTQLSDSDQDLVYSVTLTDIAMGEAMEYKFRLNGVLDGREEYAGTEQQRRYIPFDGENVVAHVYANAAAEPVKAQFTASATSIKAGESVSFTNLSTGNPESFSWEFEGGTPATSEEENPTVSYSTPGSYAVTLTVSKGGGGQTDSKTIENFISVSLDADPIINVSPESFTATTPITITANVSGNAQLEALNEAWLWAWVPGVGDAPTNINPATAAADAAKFTKVSGNVWELQLTPTDFFGFSASEITSIGLILKAQDWSGGQTENFVFNVASGDAPVANFSANFTTVEEGGTVQFTDLSTNNPTSWSWDFGDGSTSTQQNPSKEFTATGQYTVSLQATNAFGSDTETKTQFIEVTSVTGLEDTALSRSIQLFPNPTTKEIYLSQTNKLRGTFRVSLLSVSGKELYYWYFEKKQPTEEWKIELPGLSAGIYFFRIGTSRESALKRVIIK